MAAVVVVAAAAAGVGIGKATVVAGESRRGRKTTLSNLAMEWRENRKHLEKEINLGEFELKFGGLWEEN